MSEPTGSIRITFDPTTSDRIRKLRGMMDEKSLEDTIAHALSFYSWYSEQRLEGKTLQLTDGKTSWDIEMDWL